MKAALRLLTSAVICASGMAHADCTETQIDSAIQSLQVHLNSTSFVPLSQALNSIIVAAIPESTLPKLRAYNNIVSGTEKLELELAVANNLKKFAQAIDVNATCDSDYRAFESDSGHRIVWSCKVLRGSELVTIKVDLNDGMGFIRTQVSQRLTLASPAAANVSYEIFGRYDERYGKVDESIGSGTGLRINAIFPANNHGGGSVLGFGYKGDKAFDQIRADMLKRAQYGCK